jgi:hypothetical protein
MNRGPLYLPLIILLITPAYAPACMMSDSEKAELFQKFDSNNDNTISLEEYVAGEAVRVGKAVSDEDRAFYKTRFESMDDQKSGAIALAKFDPISHQKCM